MIIISLAILGAVIGFIIANTKEGKLKVLAKIFTVLAFGILCFQGFTCTTKVEGKLQEKNLIASHKLASVSLDKRLAYVQSAKYELKNGNEFTVFRTTKSDGIRYILNRIVVVEDESISTPEIRVYETKAAPSALGFGLGAKGIVYQFVMPKESMA